MRQAGFYIIKDEFFKDMNDPYLKGNKSQNRPHYYCFKEAKNNIYWMIPLSSKIDKYKKIIENKKKNGRSHNGIYIIKMTNGKESAFLIQDIFPITESYIDREYNFAGKPLYLKNKHDIREIEKRAIKIINALKHGAKLIPTQPNILAILEKLESVENE